jgi:cytoskeletal protein CcmA (bactofilin family)
MFGKSNKDGEGASGNGPKAMNQIGQGTEISGEISANGDIRVDGKVTGSVRSKSKVVVGATGMVEGDINCQNAYIDGRVTGNIEVSDLLILSKTAHVLGDIIIKKLVVEEGAKFNGKCTMGITISRNNEKETTESIPRQVKAG